MTDSLDVFVKDYKIIVFTNFDTWVKNKNIEYKLFEAIMCLSIPILEDNSDIFCKDYKFYTKDQPHIYDKEMALYNYDIFIKKNQLVI